MSGNAKPVRLTEDEQPELWGADELPCRPVLQKITREYLHTGSTVSKDHVRVGFIIKTYLELGEIARTCRTCGCSPNTLKVLMNEAEAAGKVDGFKQRVNDKFGLMLEMGQEKAIREYRADRVPPPALSINIGVAYDKKALMDGEATSRVEAIAAAPVEREHVLAYLAAKQIKAPALEVISSEEPQKPQGKP
jgi:transposase-like protein